MPRGTPAAFQTQAARIHTLPILLGTGYFDSGARRIWSGIGNLSFSGTGDADLDGRTWTGGGHIIELSPFSSTGKPGGSGFDITFNYLDIAYAAIALQEPIINRLLEMRIGFFNPDMTSTSNRIAAPPVLFFRGFMDTGRVQVDPQSRTFTWQVRAENLFLRQRNATGRRRTHKDHTRDFPNDPFYQYVTSINNEPTVWPAAGWKPRNAK